MPKNASDFTAEQRAAVIESDVRNRARQIQGQAQAGTLKPGLAPFKVSLQSITEWRRKAAAERRLNGSPRASWDDLELDAAELLREGLEQIRDDARETGKIDLPRFRAWAGTFKSMRGSYGVESKGIKAEDGPERETPSLLARLSTPDTENTDAALASDETDEETETDAA